MRPNRVKALWREGKPVAAAWCSTPDPFVADIMARAGFDALLLDMQHGMGIGPDRAAAWLQAVSQTETVPLVRVPWNEPAYIQWVLDAGAYGVVIPLVSKREEAARGVGACRYPPLGYRSWGPNRVLAYAGSDYFQRANEEIICLIMIEGAEAVANLEEMVSVPGIDGFFIGPADLGISLGLGPSAEATEDPRHVEACKKVLETAEAHGLMAGRAVSGVEEAVGRFRQGYKFCPISSDVRSIGVAMAAEIAEFRRLTG